jgi:hypothetical protein
VLLKGSYSKTLPYFHTLFGNVEIRPSPLSDGYCALEFSFLLSFSYPFVLYSHILALRSPQENMSCCLIIRRAKILYPKFIKFYWTTTFQFGSTNQGTCKTICAIGMDFKTSVFSLKTAFKRFFYLAWLKGYKRLKLSVVS